MIRLLLAILLLAPPVRSGPRHYNGRLYAVDLARGDLLVVLDHKVVRLHPGWDGNRLRRWWLVSQDAVEYRWWVLRASWYEGKEKLTDIVWTWR